MARKRFSTEELIEQSHRLLEQSWKIARDSRMRVEEARAALAEWRKKQSEDFRAHPPRRA